MRRGLVSMAFIVQTTRQTAGYDLSEEIFSYATGVRVTLRAKPLGSWIWRTKCDLVIRSPASNVNVVLICEPVYA